MKPIWNGTLSFGLVTIPIKLFSAIEPRTTHFTMLCNTCNKPLHYERYCTHCDKEVAWDDIVKGLALGNKKFVVLTKEKINTLKPHTTDTLEITEFVDRDQVSPLYLENHYYVSCHTGGSKAFNLFTQALEHAGKIAIGTFVMHDKEHVCAIQPYEDILLLSTLYYAYEIRKTKSIAPQKTKAIPGELKLALQLIGQLSEKKLNLAKYKDTFANKLAKAIKKGAGKKVTARKKEKITKTKKQKITLTDSLKASLKHRRTAHA